MNNVTEPEISSEDAKVVTALSVNGILLAVVLTVYWLLHCKRRRWYYKNPIKRGFGPVRAQRPECELTIMRGTRRFWPERAPCATGATKVGVGLCGARRADVNGGL